MTKEQREGFNKICADCNFAKPLSEIELTHMLQVIYLEHMKHSIKNIDKDKLINRKDNIKDVVLEVLDMVPLGELLEERLDEVAFSVKQALVERIRTI